MHYKQKHFNPFLLKSKSKKKKKVNALSKKKNPDTNKIIHKDLPLMNKNPWTLKAWIL